MKAQTTLLIISSFILTGCGMVSSSIHYTKGTRCLENGDYKSAAFELEQAVELDPTLGRNHTNLACAYQQLGEFQKTWYHTRQAVLCEYKDAAGPLFFVKQCELLIIKPGLDQPGTPLEVIIDTLGSPDIIENNEQDNEIFYIYGLCLMKFKDRKLTACKFMTIK